MNNFGKRGLFEKRKAQVWLEVVIYTLIGLTVLGIAIGVAKPKIDELSDKVVVEQSIQSLNAIDQKIVEIQEKGVGNKRSVSIKISKGKLSIDPSSDAITWELGTRYKYSEPGKSILLPGTNLEVTTTGQGSPWTITIKAKYTNKVDIKMDGSRDVSKQFLPSPTPYNLFIENTGIIGGLYTIDITEQ